MAVKGKLNVRGVFKQKKNETEIKVAQGEKEDKANGRAYNLLEEDIDWLLNN